ncbi:MAG TPA: VWA domain-containing protein [Pilimelia sp.]|nr:VWA domain-containing protein [Pilimelia sp.]
MPGRHRFHRRYRGAGTTAAAVALIVVAVGAWVGLRQLAQPACSGQVRLTVAASADIAPALQAAAAQWSGGGAEVDNVCVAVDVANTEPADIAAAVASRHGVSLNGVGQASGTTPVPDVWVPDSSTWLLRLRSAASGFAPTTVTSVARSPVVLAMPEPLAGEFGWPNAQITWGALLSRMSTDTRLRPGIVEPTRDAAGLAGLLALGQAAGAAGADSQKTATGALRALAAGRSLLRQDLLARFPRSTDPASIARGLSAAALSEQAVIAFNSAKPPIPLAALYVEPAPLSLDYPFTIMPGIDPAKATAAEGLLAALRTSGFRDRLAGQGLRGGDGVGGSSFASPRGAPSPAGSPSPTAAPGGAAAGSAAATGIDRILSTWTAITLPARMLAIFDVSGSMNARVPSAGNVTRMQLTIETSLRGLALFDDSWAVGLWTFSTELVGAQDYREQVQIGPLTNQRDKLEAAIRALRPKTNGATGLYDTLLAGYKKVQSDWDPGRINSVLMLTDGENQDNNGITLAQLLAELKRIKDPKRPIQVVILGIGPSVGPAALEQITKTAGGGVFITEDPAKIGDIFLKAVSLRTQTAQVQIR